jgi:predicted phosphodiesterase
MDIFQEDQILYAVDSLQKMLNEFLINTDCKITYCSIHGNHDRMAQGRDEDKSRTAGKVITGFISRLMANEERLEVIMPKNNLLKLKKGNICLFAQHGDSGLNKKKPHELINLIGEGTSCYHVLLKGHWHSLKAEEGTNFLTITAPAVTSADKYILEELGHNSLPGFILGHEPNCYGFDYKKITLY